MTQEQFDSKLFTLQEELNDAQNEVESLEEQIEDLWQTDIFTEKDRKDLVKHIIENEKSF